MPRPITLFLTAAVLLLGVTLVTASATAAPGNGAQPYNESTCNDDGSGGEICFTTKGVTKANASASGNTQITDIGEVCITRVGAEPISGSCRKYHEQVMVGQDGDQVIHNLYRGFVTILGQTCTFEVNFVYANGAVRHAVNNDSC